MQTLRLLGAQVLGDFARPDLPQSANPKGYFEDLDLLRDGLSARALADAPRLLRGRAVKLALHPLVHRRSRGEWTALAQPEVRLLLPIRTPAESLTSRQVFLRSDDPRARHDLFHMSARNRLLDFGFLAEWVGAAGRHRPAPAVIDYELAIADPARYVAQVADAAALQPTGAQRSAALDNIDRDLYRFRLAGDTATRAAAGVRPLERVYDLLRANDPDRWARLRDSLPPWVSEAARAPLTD